MYTAIHHLLLFLLQLLLVPISPHSLPFTPPTSTTILVTGGAGYIGSHTCLELLNAGNTVVIVDNLSNSCEIAVNRLTTLAKLPPNSDNLHFRKVDILNGPALDSVCKEFPSITTCVHFAGLKAVGESVAKPLLYYETNVAGTLSLLRTLRTNKIKNVVFSSSATVYGEPERLPIDEKCGLSATNPYGNTKLIIEDILRDLSKSESDWNILLLRYFNPIGAHPSGAIGEDPKGIPNNLMPFVAQVCVGRRKKLRVFGNDYDTIDGTGVRDYIHVVDLAKGHVKAVEKLMTSRVGGCTAVNLGTGTGVSVLELVKGMEKISGKTVPLEIVERREGDISTCYCDPSKAVRELGWRAELDLEAMCRDTWKWQSLNPNGYKQEKNQTQNANHLLCI